MRRDHQTVCHGSTYNISKSEQPWYPRGDCSHNEYSPEAEDEDAPCVLVQLIDSSFRFSINLLGFTDELVFFIARLTLELEQLSCP